jgi:sugar lactone lactonase YvrE
MYFIDTPTSSVQAFEYDDTTGGISNREVVIKIPPEEGYPDGMSIDANDNLWIALWGGKAVAQCDPETGKILQKVYVPAPNVSSCAFGGKDLKTLYITTAREGLSKEQLKKYPLSGGLFAIELPTKGVPANFFKGKI